MGVLNDKGLGVAPDQQEAAKWYQMAADRGFANAQFKLGVLYAQGQGIPKDDIQAFMWFTLAGGKLNENAK